MCVTLCVCLCVFVCVYINLCVLRAHMLSLFYFESVDYTRLHQIINDIMFKHLYQPIGVVMV